MTVPLETAALDAVVATGTVPGYAVAVRRGRDVEFAAGGVRDLSTRAPFEPGTVHRVASLSKLVAALVAMQQAEAGTLTLDEPVTTWLPELADVRVLTTPDGPLTDTEACRRPPTVRDVLTMTSGFGVALDPTPLTGAMDAAGIHPGPVPPRFGPEEVLARLAALPLAFQPGEGWAYHTSTDVLSVVLERASGRALDELVETGVRAPLGIDVLGFAAPHGLPVATGYDPDDDTGDLQPTQPWGVDGAPPFLTLSAGLFGTAGGLLRVLDELARPTTISASSAEQIRSPWLTPHQRRSAGEFLPPGHSFGFQVSVALRDDASGPRVGSFGWSGGTGCLAVADPAMDRAGVLLTNRMLGGPDGSPAFAPFLGILCA